MTVRAANLASDVVFAPDTLTSIIFVAPSPSRAMALARYVHTVTSAC
jgi:hypothetical protein